MEIVSYQEMNVSLCLKSQLIDHSELRARSCLLDERTLSIVWTHDGTGIMKYIQWIVTRKLGNIRVSRLNNNCEIIQENYFSSNSKIDTFVQIYIVSLASNFGSKSQCSTDLVRIIKLGVKTSNQIYFKRRSIKATVAYQHLDTMRSSHNLTFDWNISFKTIIEKANFITDRLTDYFTTISKTKSVIINSEDMIHSNLIHCEKTLTDFISLLRLDTSAQIVKYIIEYDLYQFMKDATWWDQSETIERILSKSLPQNQEKFTYSNDFYHLHGNYSFSRYLLDSRQCFSSGIFPQMQHETIPNRFSTDKPERCSLKQFDCAFSDLYSFSDREHLYQPYASDTYFNRNSIKCAFAIQSILDKVRNLYKHNHTCQTVVFTCITNCYDPLPNIQDKLPPQICFVALLDTKTMDAFKREFPRGTKIANTNATWDLIDLGDIGSLFRVPAKVTETLKIVGYRMFPMAKWIVWLDGKAFIINIKEVLSKASSSVVGLHHSDFSRTSENEVNLTLNRVMDGETPNSLRLNITLQEIELQETEYKRDGFYSRSAAIGLPLFDIAIFIYRNNHPCNG
jgi:hypothetical protein